MITQSPYLSGPNILAHPDRTVQEVNLCFEDLDCIKAGAPINAEGQVANNETAIGLLLHDVHKGFGCGKGLVVIRGRIDSEVAAANSGMVVSKTAKAAMVDLTFTGDCDCIEGRVPYVATEGRVLGVVQIEREYGQIIDGQFLLESNLVVSHDLYDGFVDVDTGDKVNVTVQNLQNGVVLNYEVVVNSSDLSDLPSGCKMITISSFGATLYFGAAYGGLEIVKCAPGSLYGTYKISIDNIKEVIHPVDAKFLPSVVLDLGQGSFGSASSPLEMDIDALLYDLYHGFAGWVQFSPYDDMVVRGLIGGCIYSQSAGYWKFQACGVSSDIYIYNTGRYNPFVQ